MVNAVQAVRTSVADLALDFVAGDALGAQLGLGALISPWLRYSTGSGRVTPKRRGRRLEATWPVPCCW